MDMSRGLEKELDSLIGMSVIELNPGYTDDMYVDMMADGKKVKEAVDTTLKVITDYFRSEYDYENG